jgi:hypothetical protein
MKKLLFIIALFLSFSLEAQIVVNRSPITIAVQDARLAATFAFKIPVFPDTATATAYIGHDSLGYIFYNQHDSIIYFRTINPSGTRKWLPMGTGTGGSGVITFNARAGNVTPQASDYSSFYPSLSGSYPDPVWIQTLSASKIVGSQTVSAGSSKINLGGTPSGASLQPFSIDVVPGNIPLSTLGGLLNISQINATGSPSGSTVLFGNGTWGSPGGAGTGLPNSNIGAGFRWAVPGTNNIKTLFLSGYLIGDSSSNSNGITITSDTGTGKLATKSDLISRITAYNGLTQIKNATRDTIQLGGPIISDIHITGSSTKNIYFDSIPVFSAGLNNTINNPASTNPNFYFGSNLSSTFSTSQLMFGFNNQTIGSSSYNMLFGSVNKMIGNDFYNFIYGSNNTVNTNGNSTTFVFGANDTSFGGNSGIIFGSNNKINVGHTNVFVTGQNNTSTSNNEVIFGRWADSSSNIFAFEYGNGTSSAARSNLFAVDASGYYWGKGLSNSSGFKFIMPTDGTNDTIATRNFVRSIGGGGSGASNPFADNTALIKSSTDFSKLAIISASLIPTSTTNVYTLPSVFGTFDLTSNTATLTNKTISAASNTISGLTNSNLSGSAGITNANLATMANLNVKGNFSGSITTPSDVSMTTLTANLNVFTSTLQGSVPASGGGALNFLRADGGWFKAYQPIDTISTLATKSDIFSHPTIARNGLTFYNATNSDTIRLGGQFDRDLHWSGINTYNAYFDSTKLFLTGTNYISTPSGDTTTYKPLAINATTGETKRLTYWPGSGGGGGGGVALDSVQLYTTGTTLTQLAGSNIIQLNPTTTQASLTITTQGNAGTWHNGNYLTIVAGGTLGQGSTVITSLSIVAGTGMTINEAVIPKIIMAGESIVFKKIGNNLYRIN